MRRQSSWIILSAVLILLGLSVFRCGDNKKSDNDDDSGPNGDFSLTVSGSGFEQHNGQTMAFRVFDRDNETLSSIESVTMDSGAFKIEFGKVLNKNGNYYLQYFADLNKNGTCDAPPTDHTWTIKLDNVTSNKVIEEDHRMSFTDNCDYMNGTYKPATNTAQITGTLSLDADISQAEGLEAGQALAGGTVFAQGFPDQEAISNEDGTFVLNIDLGDSGLTATDLKLTMWYTQPDTDTASTDVYDFSKARFGTIADVPVTASETKDIGKQSLTFTTRVRFEVTDGTNSIDKCWIEVIGFDFQLVSQVVEVKDDFYGDKKYHAIDYMPAGDYQFRAFCPGYKEKTFDVIVTQVDPSEWLTLDPVVLEKASH